MDTGRAGATIDEESDRRVFRMDGARIADLSGKRRVPVGISDLPSLLGEAVFIDKTLLIKDLLDNPTAATLFCRPRRFGKTLAMSMLKTFFEIPVATESPIDSISDRANPFDGLSIWDVDGGRYRTYHQHYPVIFITLSQAKQTCWKQAYANITELIASEYTRHVYLTAGDVLTSSEKAHFKRVMERKGDLTDIGSSLKRLALYLHRYHGSPCIVLIDEYDAPVMAGVDHGFRDEAVSFLRTWLTGALKDGGQTVFRSCLTGVQRVTGESLFSDLNNIDVNTPLSLASDERFGFTTEEVRALATYLGHPDKLDELAEWYDGYRFGDARIYNPWSVLMYFSKECEAAPYWVNTSSNTLIGRVLDGASDDTWSDIHELLEPNGSILAPLSPNSVFADVNFDQVSLWSLLYLSGYVTTDDNDNPGDRLKLRRLRLPNREVGSVFSTEIVTRYRSSIGLKNMTALQEATVSGDAEGLQKGITRIIENSLSFFDLYDENSCHNLLLGLLWDTQGYDVISESKHGIGRCDIRMTPVAAIADTAPVITLELKWLGKSERPRSVIEQDAALETLAQEALAQIADKGYDASDINDGRACIRMGLGFCASRVAVVAAHRLNRE